MKFLAPKMGNDIVGSRFVGLNLAFILDVIIFEILLQYLNVDIKKKVVISKCLELRTEVRTRDIWRGGRVNNNLTEII